MAPTAEFDRLRSLKRGKDISIRLSQPDLACVSIDTSHACSHAKIRNQDRTIQRTRGLNPLALCMIDAMPLL